MDQKVEIWIAPIQAKTTGLSCTSAKGEHGVMIWAGIIMDFVCGTVGVPDSVKRNSPS